MRRTLALAAVVAAALQAASASGGSGVNACTLVTTKQAASLGVTQSCKATTRPGSVGVVSGGNWGSPGVTSAALALTVNTFSNTNNPIWETNMRLLKVLPGTPRKVNGIGSTAYESGGGGSTVSSIHFVLGKRVVVFSWYSKKPQTSLKVFNAVAKSIAAQL